MNIAASCLKMVPDIVEELEVAGDGRSLDLEFLRLIVNERDDHALEQALLLKERHGGTVTVVALEAPEVDDVLFTALAKGADRAVKVDRARRDRRARAAAAAVLAAVLPGIPSLLPADLVLAGCQAIDDLDGVLAPLLAERLGLPYLGIVTAVTVEAAGRAGHRAQGVRRRRAGPLRGPPAGRARHPGGREAAALRAGRQGAGGHEVAGASRQVPAGERPAAAPLLEVTAMAKPEAAGHAEMLEGGPTEVAAKVVDILAARGLL